MNQEILQLGVVGCGAIAQFVHLPALTRTRRVRLSALCDSSEDLLVALGRKTGCSQLYASYEQLLVDSRVQAVLIAVPDPFHVALAAQALRAGKHVLVEKPLGVSSAECRELVALVRQSGLKLQVGSMKRHDPGLAYARQFIEQRAGRIFSVAGVYRDTLFRPAMQESCLAPPIAADSPERTASDYKQNRERYNLWTQGAHLFDTLRFLAGDITAVTVQVARNGGQFTWHGLAEFAGGGCGHFELTCKSCGDRWEQYTVYGESGSVDVRVGLPFYHRPAQVQAFDGGTQQWSCPLGGHSNAYVNQLEAFGEAIFHDRPTSPDAADGLAVVRLLECVEASIREGIRVEVPPNEAL